MKKRDGEFFKGIIINRRERIGPSRNVLEKIVVVIMHVGLIYILRPVILMTLWYLGWEFAYEHMIRLGGYKELRYFGFLAVAAIVIGLMIIGWNRYNVYRFRNRERRKAAPPASKEAMGTFFKVAPEGMAALQESQSVDIVFSNGQLAFFPRGGATVSGFYDPQNRFSGLEEESSESKAS